jgi:GntR family transcriptional regulator
VELAIDRRSKTPSWVQVHDAIKAVIDSCELGPDDAVPSLMQITSQTGLAIATVQKAIRCLEEEGYHYAVSGRGTFVGERQR